MCDQHLDSMMANSIADSYRCTITICCYSITSVKAESAHDLHLECKLIVVRVTTLSKLLLVLGA